MGALNKYKYKYKDNLLFNRDEQKETLFIAKVLDVTDPYNAGRIKVAIKGIDDKNVNRDTPIGGEGTGKIMEAFPLLPKMIGIRPNVNESVFIFTQTIDGSLHRFWVGPIISQQENLINDAYDGTSQSGLKKGTSKLTLSEGLSLDTNANGVYPDEKYLSMQGRDNTDIIHKSSELLLRAGKFVKGKPLVYNHKTMAYIQIKDNMILENDKKLEARAPYSNAFDTIFDIKQRGSAITLVGNRINLISHDGSPRFDTLVVGEKKQEQVVRDIIEKAHPLVFGDTLIKILTIFRDHALNHVHQINSSPIEGQKEYGLLSNAKLDTILSKNIRIN